MEEACKVQPKMMWPTEQLPALAFQMLFSLYSAQRELGLRHYDVKLLNFFLAKPTIRLPRGHGNDVQTVALHYGCFGRQYTFHLSTDEPSMAMLADFGTADIAPVTPPTLTTAPTPALPAFLPSYHRTDDVASMTWQVPGLPLGPR